MVISRSTNLEELLSQEVSRPLILAFWDSLKAPTKGLLSYTLRSILSTIFSRPLWNWAQVSRDSPLDWLISGPAYLCVILYCKHMICVCLPVEAKKGTVCLSTATATDDNIFSQCSTWVSLLVSDLFGFHPHRWEF